MSRLIEILQTLWYVLQLSVLAMAISLNRRAGRWLIRRYLRLPDWDRELPC